MKWWPLLSALVLLVSTCAVLLYRMDLAEKRQDKQGEWMQRHSQDISDLKVECARLGSR